MTLTNFYFYSYFFAIGDNALSMCGGVLFCFLWHLINYVQSVKTIDEKSTTKVHLYICKRDGRRTLPAAEATVTKTMTPLPPAHHKFQLTYLCDFLQQRRVKLFEAYTRFDEQFGLKHKQRSFKQTKLQQQQMEEVEVRQRPIHTNSNRLVIVSKILAFEMIFFFLIIRFCLLVEILEFFVLMFAVSI